ncbi:MAG: DUF418 domain-containing protein, partial [Propionibacteriaceae bacterium]|nr:DUF418 domain-containing protein [Propionibacteriaceae bacterium]
LGWIFARHEVLEHPERWRPQLIKLAIGGIALGWLAGIPVALEHLQAPLWPTEMGWGYATLNYAGGTATGLGYAAAIALIAARLGERRGPVTRAFAAVGSRSLTFYLFQSVIFAPLLSAWGLGLGERINTTLAVAIAFGIWLASLVIASLLEARNLRGPAEVLLRKMTYLSPERLGAPVIPPGPPPPAPARTPDNGASGPA